MATYAIGDIQGCYEPLLALLDHLDFDQRADHLWLTGDLVNRGPCSLEVLRFVRDLGTGAVTVLGNHDLHLLALAYAAHPPKRKDTLAQVLRAPDRDELLDWLRSRPLIHHDAGLGYTVIHAGLPPQWDLDAALRCAGEVEAALRGAQAADFLQHMYGDYPARWEETGNGWERLRFITNCLTRLRYCDAEGRIDFADSGPPGTQRPGLMPWFRVPGRASAGLRIVFGHWSTLGPFHAPGLHGLDTGCVWGGHLTALRLEDGQTFAVPCAQSQTPHLRPPRTVEEAVD
jgi:bis(5'-nucleosyl)-tetraphosphatase (symmetrical)